MYTKLLSKVARSCPSFSCIRRISPAVNRFSTSGTVQNGERPRRSLLSVPGSDPRKIEKAATLSADAIVLDLEDGVPMDKKMVARQLVTEALQTRDFGDAEVCVRINALDTGRLALDDLQAILVQPALQSIVVPKLETAADLEFVRRLVGILATNAGRNVRILGAIESARGLMNLQEIAKAGTGATSLPCAYLDALIFASEDYCADLELIRTESATEMLYARSKLVTVAKAYGLQAIDMVHIDFRNLEDLERECQEGREMGFTGKQAIHPAQLETIHRKFAPSATDIDFARKCVREYEAATATAGKGACVVDGIVVDAPVYKWALKILKRDEKAGL
jgi:citrate lyase subunit beta-like protein